MPYKDPEVAKLKNNEYREKNKDALRLKRKKWELDNQDKIIESFKNKFNQL